MIRERSDVVSEIYLASDPETVVQLLTQWHVDYLYMGNTERYHFDLGDANIAIYDSALRLLFTQGGVRVYTLP